MKILAINGSPNRDGATAGLMDMLLEECKTLGAQCERINIEDYLISECQDCGKCLGALQCVLDDDYTQLKARMLDSDAIVIGSPFYSGSAVIALKTFIKRLAYDAFCKKDFAGKYIVGLSTSAVDDSSAVASYCANLGLNSKMGGFIVSSLLCEHMVIEEGLKEIEEDSQIRNNTKVKAEKLIDDIRNKRVPNHYSKYNYIYTKTINYCVIKFIRNKEKISNNVKRILIEKGWIKESKKVSE